MSILAPVATQADVRDAWSDINDRYVKPAAREMRRAAIECMTDCGIWKEQAEYLMDTLFTREPLPFADFLDQHADLARVLWPVTRH